MTSLVLMFMAILLATFTIVLVMMRKSPLEKTMDQRMALIHGARKGMAASTETEQLFKVTTGGNFAWLDDLLEHYSFSQMLKRQMMQANSSLSVAKLLLTSFGVGFAGFVLAWFFQSLLLVDLAAGLLLGFLPFAVLSWRRKKRVSAFNAVLAETIDMLARALRAGHSVLGAIEMLTENAQEPACSEFGEVFKQMNLGLPMRDALMQLLDRVPSR